MFFLSKILMALNISNMKENSGVLVRHILAKGLFILEMVLEVSFGIGKGL